MSNFKEWIDYTEIATSGSTKNIEDGSTYTSSEQRQKGFKSGTVISSSFVNSGLRQANLVVTALMNLTGDTSLDLTSRVEDVQSALGTYFNSLSVNSISYTTIVPTASPAEGTLLIYVGTTLPSTQYDRVLYLITN